MIDVSEQVSAVRRQVGGRVLEAGQGRVVTVRRTYDTAVADLWDACTNPERIPRWFLPVTGDLRVGGHYQLEGNAGGKIEQCDPPVSFAATWEYGDEVSWIEVHLSPAADGGTEFCLEHVAHVDDERWAEFGPGAVGVGWDLGLLGLTLHLRSGDTVNPEEVAGWSASEEGRRFMRLSSDHWGDANVAAGTDETLAREAADRTTAFYTGPAPDAAEH